jgi:hypothetical protein
MEFARATRIKTGVTRIADIITNNVSPRGNLWMAIDSPSLEYFPSVFEV